MPGGRRSGPRELRIRVIAEGETLVVFRVVQTDDRRDPKYLESFKSRWELGLAPRRGSPEERFKAIRTGISCFSTRKQAEEIAKRWGKGEFIARLRLDADAGFSYARWGSAGHLTIWGEPVKLAQSAVDILAIRN